MGTAGGGHVASRRASPPRPTLMVGDRAACQAAYTRLQVLCNALQHRHAGQADWRDLVPRFRALRESLLSHGAVDTFVAAVFEASAGACLRAGDFGEFLKAVQHLNLTIYPALAADDQGAAQLQSLRLDARPTHEESPANGGPAETHPPDSCALTSRAASAGAFLLYFACIPPEPQSMDIASVLRQLPPALQRCPQARFALDVHQAVRCCDALGFLSLHSRASWVQRALMEPRLQQMRQQAVMVLGCAYRSISTAAAAQLLHLEGPSAAQQLQLHLQACARGGCARAACALSALQTAEQHGAILTFRC